MFTEKEKACIRIFLAIIALWVVTKLFSHTHPTDLDMLINEEAMIEGMQDGAAAAASGKPPVLTDTSGLSAQPGAVQGGAERVEEACAGRTQDACAAAEDDETPCVWDMDSKVCTEKPEPPPPKENIKAETGAETGAPPAPGAEPEGEGEGTVASIMNFFGFGDKNASDGEIVQVEMPGAEETEIGTLDKFKMMFAAAMGGDKADETDPQEIGV